MLKTIGYAYSEGENHYHLTPILFFNEPGLEHLDWITTLFPRADDEDPEAFLHQKLENFIQYYPSPLLIIGTDTACLQGILNAYTLPTKLIVEGTPLEIELPSHISDDAEHTIVCINAEGPIPSSIPKGDIMVLIHYDSSEDLDKTTFNEIKKLLITTKTQA